MKKFSFFLILASFLFLFPSCNEEKNYLELYKSGNYEELLKETDSAIEKELSDDAIYYKMLCHYNLQQYSEAGDAALLYYAMYNSSNEEKTDDALRILLYYSSDPAVRLKAGSTICSHPGVLLRDQLVYYSVLMKNDLQDEASALYNVFREEISGRQAAVITLNARSSSTLIVSNLESWLSEEGRSEDFDNSVKTACSLLISRNEGSLILSLALSIWRESDNVLSILIGDIYAQMGQIEKARSYYSLAYRALPDIVEQRLYSL